jgi:sulfite exporter TauE/SafE
MLLPYHAGRLTTYVSLGLLTAGAGGLLASQPAMHWLRAAWLTAAAALFLLNAIGVLIPAAASTPRMAGLLGRLTRRLDRSSASGTYRLGLALGFLPCGLLYAALVTAASIGNALWGAAAMLAFGLGTVPVLAAIGIGGARLASHSRSIRALGPAVLLLNAACLIALAWADAIA